MKNSFCVLYTNMKNEVRKQFLKDIRKHARDFIKNLRAKNRFKKVAYKRLKGEIIRYLQKKNKVT